MTETQVTKIEVPSPVAGGRTEVFDSQEELIKGKQAATAKIIEQEQRIRELEAAVATVPGTTTTVIPSAEPEGFDRNAYFNTLYADPLRAFDQAFEARFGMSVEEAQSGWQRMSAAEQYIASTAVASQWATEHSDVVLTPTQSRAIEQIINENGWPYTKNSLDGAYALAVQRGIVKVLPNATQADTLPPEPPATMTSATGGGETLSDEAEVAHIRSLPLDQQRAAFSARAERIRSGR